MNSYFEVGVRYDETMEDGVVRKVTENYLLDALTFTGGCQRNKVHELFPLYQQLKNKRQ